MKGLIFLPDISGFTGFVKNIDIDIGVSVTENLLNAVIESNPLDVELSEIEGDAILFYKLGEPISLSIVFEGVDTIYESFNNKFKILKKAYGLEVDLSLKFFVHFGEINVYNIKGFRKLYGETVIEAHSLLKNGYDATDYILITDDYFSSLNKKASDIPRCNWKLATHGCRTFNNAKEIGFYFFTYQHKRS